MTSASWWKHRARRREARWHRVVQPFGLDGLGYVGDARIYHAALQVGHDCLGDLLAKNLHAAPVVQVDVQRDVHDEDLMLLLRDQRSKGLGQSPKEETKEGEEFLVSVAHFYVTFYIKRINVAWD